MAIKNVADLYLYPNTVRAVRITGAQVREWLERSAGMFNQITPGMADQVLLNPDFPSYNFDVIDGVTYQIDLSQASRYNNDGEVVAPDAHRIVNLMYEGAPIDDDRNSSSPPTTTARAAAATSPAPTPRR
jgi:2',3'-cyclic-nucleotide 2'-phosphodiesterase/3'-nucleotidase